MILENQRLLDFGKGFYTTSNQKQAEKWASIKQKRIGNAAKAIVSVFEINDEYFDDQNYAIRHFQFANEEWLDFVVLNRQEYKSHSYDIVKGAVANDTLYATLVLFETGILSKKETIVRLKTHKLFDQISFHSEKILRELKFVESYEITE
ncbi:MAG: DUF3990 domain-containing protein [Paludibacter sp.]|nr:DUF3990 domain-containing protein [Paludibacter sp.]